jgi:hypothetical protein
MTFQLKDAVEILEGTHPQLGRVTLEQLVATWTVHDLNHIEQIVQWMAARYRDVVGPWRAYLPILERSAGSSD